MQIYNAVMGITTPAVNKLNDSNDNTCKKESFRDMENVTKIAVPWYKQICLSSDTTVLDDKTNSKKRKSEEIDENDKDDDIYVPWYKRVCNFVTNSVKNNETEELEIDISSESSEDTIVQNDNTNSKKRKSKEMDENDDDDDIDELWYKRLRNFLTNCVKNNEAEELNIDISSESSEESIYDGSKDQRITEIIDQLLSIKNESTDTKINLRYSDIEYLCDKAIDALMSDSMLLRLEAPINICGDIHGQYFDLLNIFDKYGNPDSNKYLFLGDYVDRGDQSIETICLLLAYKIKYPANMHIIRGNHECEFMNIKYGFVEECTERYDRFLSSIFANVFECMPVAAVVNDKVFCVHGGLSQSLKSLEDIDDIQRPVKVSSFGILCDLLWADPHRSEKDFVKSPRGISFMFNEDVVKRFLEHNNFELICRAHEVVTNGYEYFANKSLVTIFSAPNYAKIYDNFGAILELDNLLNRTFLQFTSVYTTE